MKTITPLLGLLLAGVFLCACPEKSGTKEQRGQSLKVCVRFGESCEFAPGKLGTCVTKPDCDETRGPVGACLVCQSQH